jgi:hypothetical protein
LVVPGHVTIGGSICMEMLTKSGWRPTNDLEVMTYVGIVFTGERPILTGHQFLHHGFSAWVIVD